MGAHRVAFWIGQGRPQLPGHEVCHVCDNRCCVNPGHLFEGSHQDNIDDMMKKGRLGYRPIGVDQHCAKLNPELVREIRVSKLTIPELSRRYGVGNTTISKVLTRKTWKHVA